MTTVQPALEDLTPHQLIAEIGQISAQYAAEVSTKRRTWPASVWERIVALRRQGVSPYRIAQLTEVPYTTIVNWFCKPKSKAKVCAKDKTAAETDGGRFLPIVQGRSQSITTPESMSNTDDPVMTVRPTTVVGLTVALPGEERLENLTVKPPVSAERTPIAANTSFSITQGPSIRPGYACPASEAVSS